MRRKDREISAKDEIFRVLSQCSILRLAISGAEHPYIVPLSFGAERKDGTVIVYFHCAKQGMKVDLLQQNPKVCIEGELFHGMHKMPNGITAHYESVIGFGRCEFLSEPNEVIHALRLITDHYGYTDYDVAACASLPHTLVGKITLSELTGKRNLPD